MYERQEKSEEKVIPSRRKELLSSNSVPFIDTEGSKGSQELLIDNSFVLAELNETSHFSPHSTMDCRSSSISPAISTLLNVSDFGMHE